MTNSEFIKILNDDSLELTVEELENIIEEELQKDESEMDPDLIEYCLYYINKAESNNGKDEKTEPDTKKPKKHRFGGKAKKDIDNSRDGGAAACRHGSRGHRNGRESQKQCIFFL